MVEITRGDRVTQQFASHVGVIEIVAEAEWFNKENGLPNKKFGDYID